MRPPSRSTAGANVVGETSRVSVAGENLAELGGERVRLPPLAVLVAHEAAVATRKLDSLDAESLGRGQAAALRELALGSRAHPDHDPRRCSLDRLEVRLEAGEPHDVVGEHQVVAAAVV